jgi:hypothetical protein
LEGEEADPPWEWVISRICEEFNCLPSQALNEMLDDPSSMALEIIELRAYARAKELIDTTDKQDKLPNNPMIDRVFEITDYLGKQEKQRRGQNERKGINCQAKS